MPQSSFLLPSSHFTLHPLLASSIFLAHFPPRIRGRRLTLAPPESDQPDQVKGLCNHTTTVPMSCKLDSSRSGSCAPLLFLSFRFCCLLPFSADFFSFRMANPRRIFPRLITERRINMYDGSRPRISREKTERGE